MSEIALISPLVPVLPKAAPKVLQTRRVVSADDTAASEPVDIHHPNPEKAAEAAPDEPATRLTVEHHDGANRFVYLRIDQESGDVVWQYPIEQVLRLAQKLREMEGLEDHQIDKRV